jgi:hypothetical protein
MARQKGHKLFLNLTMRFITLPSGWFKREEAQALIAISLRRQLIEGLVLRNLPFVTWFDDNCI